MKKIIYTFVAAAIMAVCGCSEDSTQIDTAATIYGSVSDESDGNPIAGINVKLSVCDGYGSVISTAVTGSDGGFAFPELDPQLLYAVEIDHTDYEYLLQRVRVAAGERKELHLLIKHR